MQGGGASKRNLKQWSIVYVYVLIVKETVQITAIYKA